MFILSLILSFFTFSASGPSVDVEKNEPRLILQDLQPVNPCAGTGCR